DDWVYDFSEKNLISKITFFIKNYNYFIKINDNSWNNCIKWSRDLKNKFNNKVKINFNKNLITLSNYRPFIKKYWYYENVLTDRFTKNHLSMFGVNLNQENTVICINIGNKEFNLLSSKYLVDLHFNGDSQCLPLYIYDKDGNRHDNITDWALNQFKNYYENPEYRLKSVLQKIDIFHYVYAVLHNPIYREKYELNLKREFPRIPFYNNFFQWADWGKQLMDLHLNYETIEKYPLKRIDLESAKIPKAKLKADKENNLIILDDNTTLSDIPAIAWDYKLGNRSALEWILDQYKEKTPKDKTIAEQFNNYRFADYKEAVIDLLMRVTTVSIETMKIIEMMRQID
ncbi:MAG: hypothetical protein RL637_1605, partial [Pseudomonadota bacterium]